MDETLKNAEQLVESTRLYPPAATQHTSLKGGSTPISRSAPTDFLGTHNFLWGDEMPCEPYLESVLCVTREAIVQRVSAKIRATSISTVSRFHLLLQVLSMHCNHRYDHSTEAARSGDLQTWIKYAGGATHTILQLVRTWDSGD